MQSSVVVQNIAGIQSVGDIFDFPREYGDQQDDEDEYKHDELKWGRPI